MGDYVANQIIWTQGFKQAKSRLCTGDHKIMNHIINGGNEIAQTDYKLCHGKTTTAIQWHVCKNYNFQISQMW